MSEKDATAEGTAAVVHNEGQKRFELQVGEHLVHTDYRREGDTLVFHHTYTPAAVRGRGLAAEVVRAGLEYARRSGLKVDPRCSYVARFIERHPEYGQEA